MKRLLMILQMLFFMLGVVSWQNDVLASEKYPVKPITCIIPTEAGGDADLNARPLLQKTSAILGKPIIVVNKPGAASTIAYREIYQARPDGYTFGIPGLALFANKLMGLFPHDYRDFTLLGSFNAHYPMIFASTKTKRPFTTIQEVFSFAKANPGEVSIATGARGSSYWVTAMLIMESTGLKFNIIPQEGAGGFVVNHVSGGHSDIGIAGGSSAKPQIDAGNLRPLATLRRQGRIPKFNDVPTLKEAGYDIIINNFLGAMGPPKMPKDVTETLVKVLKIAGNDPEYQNYLISRYESPEYMSPEQLFNFCDEQRKVYRTIFDKAGLLKEK